jgi:DNA adenine methylase
LKWAGGKRWLAHLVRELLEGDGRHVEPFAGSAACFFASHARDGRLSDNNDELMNCYRMVRSHPMRLINALSVVAINKTTFSRFRAAREKGLLKRAVRFLYLNRTAFNGLYRVNQLGHFNVPFGCKPTTVVCDRQNILICSERLQNVNLVTCDFRTTLRQIRNSDRLYIDPPYTVKHNNNAFRRYNERIFSWEDQVGLAQMSNRLAVRGVRMVVTNALHPDITAMYSRKLFRAFAVVRASNMAASADKRGSCEELLLVSRAAAPVPKVMNQLMESLMASRAIPLKLPCE